MSYKTIVFAEQDKCFMEPLTSTWKTKYDAVKLTTTMLQRELMHKMIKDKHPLIVGKHFSENKHCIA